MKLITVLSLLFASMYIHSSDTHEFHLSKTTINYKTDDSALQITMMLFLDDLESGLRKQGIDSLQLCTKFEVEGAEDYVAQYIYDHFVIKSSGAPLEYYFLGKEISEDLTAVWCYLEIENIDTPEFIEVENTIMLELFDDQKNMVSLQKDTKRIDDELFDQEKTKFTFEL